jgi:DNA polymerase-3 subunit delta
MVALKSADIDAFVARPNAAQPIALVYGPDSGLVRERTEALIRACVDDPRDPFALARLEGDEISADPARLVDEAQTVPLFGGRRAVWVRAGSRNIAPAVEALIDAKVSECRVIIEAGDLKRNAPLRILCERAKSAAALPCYADNERDLARLVDDELSGAGLTIAPDVRAALVPFLGGDRRASRSELTKLILYAHGQTQVVLDDVLAVVADASALALDAVVDASFAGRTADVDTQFTKVCAAGTAPTTIIGYALRQAMALHKTRLAIEAGTPVSDALDVMTPSVHFRRKALVESALKAWTAARLERAMTQLADAALETRVQQALAESIAHRILLSVAQAARRKG